jgi:multidrug efflux system outer membrane protein
MVIKKPVESRMIQLVLMLWIIFLGGCKSPSLYPLLDDQHPTQTRSGIKIIQDSHDVSDLLWWKKMHDPLLNGLIHEALASNNQIKSAQATILQAQAQLKQAQFSWLPTVSASGNGFVGGGFNGNVASEGPLTGLSRAGDIHFRGYDAGFVPSYSLNILETMNNNKLALASLNIQKASYESTRLAIISQVSGTYFMLLGQKDQLREQRSLIKDIASLRKLEDVRFKKGASDISSVTRLDQQLVTNKANAASLENSIAQLENTLQLLRNHNPGSVIAPKKMRYLSIDCPIPDRLPSAVLKNRPDVIIAKEQLNQAEANLGLAYSNFFPTLSLTGLLGRASVELSHLLTLNTGIWVLQAAASLPVLNASAYAQIHAKKAGYSAVYFNYVQMMRSVFVDVDNKLTNYQKMKEFYRNKWQGYRASYRLYNLALVKYNTGSNDYRTLLTAKIDLSNAKMDLNLAKMQQLDSIVQVYQALAGGYAE